MKKCEELNKNEMQKKNTKMISVPWTDENITFLFNLNVKRFNSVKNELTGARTQVKTDDERMKNNRKRKEKNGGDKVISRDRWLILPKLLLQKILPT